MAGGGNFLRNLFLFPKKLSGNFHGCELRAVTRLEMFIEENVTQIPGNKLYFPREDSFEVRILNLTTRGMNVTIIYIPQVENFHTIQDESGNYAGYTARLMNDEADVALGGVTRSTTSAILMDVTKSFLQIIWEWYVPCPVKFPGWKSIFRIFYPTAWLSIFLSAVLAIIVIVFLARFGLKEYESFTRVVDAILDVWALILGVSVSPLPRTVPLRVFFSAWVCYSLAINTVFQAYLTTFLVDPGFEKSITSVDEVFTSGTKYGFSALGFDRLFNDRTNPKSKKILQNRVDCADIFTCVLWTAKYRNISSICAADYVDYLFYNSEFSDELKDSQYCGLKETPVLVTELLMTLQKGSPFSDRMNEIIDRIRESGIASYLERFSPEAKSFRKTKSNTGNSLLDEYSALNMSNMQPAFLLLLFGHCLGLISFLFEMLYFRVYSNLQQR
jgi:hypothetical protein